MLRSRCSRRALLGSVGRIWLHERFYELQIPWAVGRSRHGIAPISQQTNGRFRLDRCGVPLLLLIAFGYASPYIVRAALRVTKEPGMAVQPAWLPRIGAGIPSIFAVVAALCAAIWLPYFVARWMSSIALLVLISVLSCFLVLWVGARASARVWGALRGARFASQTAGVLTLTFAVSLYWLILKPTPDPGNPAPFANTRYWQSTGSRIAYSEFDPPLGMTVKPEPVVFLHGGPGVRQSPFDQSIYGSLSKEGFRVFLYDQAGSGLSDFLPHVRSPRRFIVRQSQQTSALCAETRRRAR